MSTGTKIIFNNINDEADNSKTVIQALPVDRDLHIRDLKMQIDMIKETKFNIIKHLNLLDQVIPESKKEDENKELIIYMLNNQLYFIDCELCKLHRELGDLMYEKVFGSQSSIQS